MRKIFLNAGLILVLACSLVPLACKKDRSTQPMGDSFLPMQIGNLWYTNGENYIEIQDTVRINSKLFYKFYSLIGGDAIAINYMRIDEQNRLIESYPTDPLKIYIKADFDASVGDKFFTSGNKDYNDNEVTVLEKSDQKMTFSFDAVYQPNLKGHPHSITYIKGKGFPGDWRKLIINGVVY